MSAPTPTTAAAPAPVFAEPTPLGLLGLSIGCAALLPIAFGAPVSLAMLKTAAIFCLLFGAGCQFLAGIMSLVNKNLLGGTLFTTFAFNWVFNWYLLSGGLGGPADAKVMLSVDVCFLIIFAVLTVAFGYYSKLLFLFLLDIDVLYVSRILKELTHSSLFALLIAFSTVVLAAIALYMAFAILVNTAAGRPVFKMPGPMFTPAPPPTA